ncbi:MAG: hypothetical protein Q9M16_05760 [Mariprofundus sp.]|nr:hypothetical protein [Mariprofundus sp.]
MIDTLPISTANKLTSTRTWLQQLLPVYALRCCMRFSQDAYPGFYHQGALTAWVRTVMGSQSDFSDYMSIDVLEQNKARFKAGDLYRFTVYGIGAKGKAYLAGLPRAIISFQTRWDAAMPFRDNWSLQGIEHFCDGEILEQTEIPLALETQKLHDEMISWRDKGSIKIHFFSPWRVLRNKASRQTNKGEDRYCRNSDDLKENNLWLTRIDDSLRKLAEDHGAIIGERKLLLPVNVIVSLAWVNAAYKNGLGKSQPMGGLIGDIDILDPSQLSEDDLALLVAGQYLGVGQRRVFGNGRYRLSCDD